MTTDAEITRLLAAGLSDNQISIQLHTDAKRARRLRASLGLPKAKSGIRPAATVENLFHARTEQLDDGHLRWTGHFNRKGTPLVRHAQKLHTAYRIAFRIRTGREPVGYAGPSCGMEHCVAPAHIDDQAARERNRTTYATLFGGLA